MGWLGGHFGDSLVALVGNMVPCQMYGIPLIFVAFSRVGGCPEGPGGSLWAVLAAHWLPGCQLAGWMATGVVTGTTQIERTAKVEGNGTLPGGSRKP